jgi:hypothetical protein
MNPSERIDRMIADLDDWRGRMLAKLRETILAADPEIVEEWKWMGSPTWSCDGLIAVGNAHKAKVKLTFAYGARFADPHGLFNGTDTGNTRRSMDFHEGDRVDGQALQALVRTAIGFNRSRIKNRKKQSGR